MEPASGPAVGRKKTQAPPLPATASPLPAKAAPRIRISSPEYTPSRVSEFATDLDSIISDPGFVDAVRTKWTNILYDATTRQAAITAVDLALRAAQLRGVADALRSKVDSEIAQKSGSDFGAELLELSLSGDAGIDTALTAPAVVDVTSSKAIEKAASDYANTQASLDKAYQLFKKSSARQEESEFAAEMAYLKELFPSATATA